MLLNKFFKMKTGGRNLNKDIEGRCYGRLPVRKLLLCLRNENKASRVMTDSLWGFQFLIKTKTGLMSFCGSHILYIISNGKETKNRTLETRACGWQLSHIKRWPGTEVPWCFIKVIYTVIKKKKKVKQNWHENIKKNFKKNTHSTHHIHTYFMQN